MNDRASGANGRGSLRIKFPFHYWKHVWYWSGALKLYHFLNSCFLCVRERERQRERVRPFFCGGVCLVNWPTFLMQRTFLLALQLDCSICHCCTIPCHCCPDLRIRYIGLHWFLFFIFLVKEIVFMLGIDRNWAFEPEIFMGIGGILSCFGKLTTCGLELK